MDLRWLRETYWLRQLIMWNNENTHTHRYTEREVCIQKHADTHIYSYIHTCTRTHTHTHRGIHIKTCMHTHKETRIHISRHRHLQTHNKTHTHIHVCAHACTHAHTHAHLHGASVHGHEVSLEHSPRNGFSSGLFINVEQCQTQNQVLCNGKGIEEWSMFTYHEGHVHFW